MTQAGFVPYSLSAPSVDTTPPTAPTNVVVSNAAANQTATVSFTGSTDNKAVIGYYAYLDGENVPWVGSQVGNSPIELTGVPAGNHTVVVKAFDAAGNLSANSSSVAFSIPNILGVNPIFTGVYPNLSAFNAQYVAGNIGLGNYLIAGSGSGVSITVNAAGLSGGGVYPSVSALNTDAASGFLPKGLYVGGDSLYIWDGVSLINDSSGYQFVKLSGNLSLAAPFAKPTVLVNSSANNYTVTLAASGIGNFSIWQLGSGTISVQSAPENLFPYANDFTQASAWTLNNGTITANQSVADPWGGDYRVNINRIKYR